MKKTLSLALVFVMILSVLLPIVANAERAMEEKEKDLFNKSVELFKPYNNLGENEIKKFVTKDVFTIIIYNLLAEEIKKSEDLSKKLGNGVKLKESIKKQITDKNISLLIRELRSGVAEESLPIFGEFITSVEELFEDDWDNIINKGFNDSDSIVHQQFTDIENHWGKDNIRALAILGIVNGYPDGTFQPNGQITRAEFSKMIALALILEPEIYNSGFSDVLIGQWHANYVATMVKNEFALGYSDATFKPNGNITRNEMAMILANVLKLEVSLEEQIILLSRFKDMGLIPDWVKDAVTEVSKAELMKGDTNNNFNGSNTATRAEAATVIYRLMNR